MTPTSQELESPANSGRFSFFNFGGFDYLVEARWRKETPDLNALLAFKGKVDRKIESTSGIVVSIPGFRPEVVQRLREPGAANLILVDGL